MGRDISLDTPDGPVNAWRADPPHGAAARDAIVVIQEIFGINAHIRGVADGDAAAGCVALAPVLFDPVERNVELAHDADGFSHSRALVASIAIERALASARAGSDVLPAQGHRHVGAVGFCWGSSLARPPTRAWACRQSVTTARRRCRTLKSACRRRCRSTSSQTIPALRAKLSSATAPQPAAVLRVHPGGHGFNRDLDPNHDHAQSAAHARRATFTLSNAALRQEPLT